MDQTQINFQKLEVNQKGNIVKKKRKLIKHSKDNALEEEDKKEIFRAIKSLDMKPEIKYKYEVLVHLMMSAGLRVSEALQVRSEWFVDSDDGIVIKIPNKARDLANLKRDWNPKTIAGAREILFVDYGIGEKVKSYFISNPKGIGMLRQRAYQVIKMLGGLINKPHLHPHALRSTYANSLVYKGVNATTLMYCMGWSNLNVALNYIKSSNVAARKDIIEKMRNTNN